MNNAIYERETEVKSKTGKILLSYYEASKYLGISVIEFDKMVNNGIIKPVSENLMLVRALDIAKFELGVQNTFTEKEENVLDKTADTALQFLQNLTDNVNEEEIDMAINKYGEGSVYWNEKRKCYQMAFYMEVNGVKQRKIVSGSTEQEVITKRGGAIALANINIPIQHQSQVVIIQGEKQSVQLPKKLIADVADEWLEIYKGSVKKATYEHSFYMAKHIKKHIGDKIISELTPAEIEVFLNKVAKPDGSDKLMSVKLIRSVKATLGQVLKFGIRSKYLTTNPMQEINIPRGIKTDKDSKFLNQTQIAMLLNAVKESKKYTTLVYLLLLSGLRIQEALSLDWGCVDRSSGYIKVNKALSKSFGKRKYDIDDTKTSSSERSVTVDTALFDKLDEWKKYTYADKKLSEKIRSMGNEQYVFLNSDGNLFNYNTLQNHFQEYLKRHGLKDVHCTFHMLRHTFGSLLLESGEELDVVSNLLGHSDINTTANIYCSITKRRKNKAAMTMGKIMIEIEDLRG